jgi:photosystem II stability/assembly factor-like uncharacterized protein
MRINSKHLGLASGLLASLLANTESAFAQNWVPTPAPVEDWSVVISSANGSNIVASSSGDGIYVSTNGGLKWTRTSAPTNYWGALAGSSDGTKLVAAANPGAIYTSTDAGASWTSNTIAPVTNWFGLASSADGTRLAAVANLDGIFTSANSGATWNQVTGIAQQQWYAIASSANGMELVAAGAPGYILMSTDGGQTWATNTAWSTNGTQTLSWSALTVSADGSRVAAFAQFDGIYISTNSGMSWTRTPTPSDAWYAATESDDGMTLYAASSRALYLSTDGGVTWNLAETSGRQWTSLACAADGSNPFAALAGGIYVPVTSPAASASGSFQGSYQGLFFEPNEISVQSSGFFSATINRKSKFTAKLQLAGSTYSFSGHFSGGASTNFIPRTNPGRLSSSASANSIAHTNLTPLTVVLRPDPRGNALDGTVSDGTWTAELAANRAVYSKTNKPSQAGQNFTMAMSAHSGRLAVGDGASQPGGVGFGSLSVNKAGNVSFRGTLDDGTPLSESTFISSFGQWPLYRSLYGGNGLLIGWLTFVNQPTNDISGAVSWIKSGQVRGKLYPAGFTNETDTIGSIYRWTNNTPPFNWKTGQVALVSPSILSTNQIALNRTNYTWTGGQNLKFKINGPSGAFNGRVINVSRPVGFNGVVLLKQNTGVGYFIGAHETGMVVVGPAH